MTSALVWKLEAEALRCSLRLARSVLLAEKKEAEQMGSLRLRHFDNLKLAK